MIANALQSKAVECRMARGAMPSTPLLFNKKDLDVLFQRARVEFGLDGEGWCGWLRGREREKGLSLNCFLRLAF